MRSRDAVSSDGTGPDSSESREWEAAPPVTREDDSSDSDTDSLVATIRASIPELRISPPEEDTGIAQYVEDSEAFENQQQETLRRNPQDFYNWEGNYWTRPARTGNRPVSRPLPEPPVNRAPPHPQNQVHHIPPGQLDLPAIDFSQVINAARLQALNYQNNLIEDPEIHHAAPFSHLSLSSGRTVTRRGNRPSIGAELLPPDQPPRPQLVQPERKGWIQNPEGAAKRKKGKQRAADQSELPSGEPKLEPEPPEEPPTEFLLPPVRGNWASAGEPSGTNSCVITSIEPQSPSTQPSSPPDSPIPPTPPTPVLRFSEIVPPTSICAVRRRRSKTIRSNTPTEESGTPANPNQLPPPTPVLGFREFVPPPLVRASRARSDSIGDTVPTETPTTSAGRTRTRSGSIHHSTVSDASTSTAPTFSQEPATRRTRARSNSIRGDHPAAVPLTPSDQSLATLIRAINQQNQEEKRRALEGQATENRDSDQSLEPGNYRSSSSSTEGSEPPGDTFTYRGVETAKTPSILRTKNTVNLPGLGNFSRKFPYKPLPTSQRPPPRPNSAPPLIDPSRPVPKYQHKPEELVDIKDPEAVQRRKDQLDLRALPSLDTLHPSTPSSKMDYQNYMQSQQGQNPRQAPPSPSPSMSGGMGIPNGPNGLSGLPTPAGHQQDLAIILNLVEQLSSQLEENRLTTRRIVANAGRVRQRAIELGMSNDEIIGEVAEELNASSRNLELENADLRNRLESAEANLDQAADDVQQFRDCIDGMLEQAHEYKYRHTMDTSAWHRSYRDQLEQEREENMQLRCKIADMGASAARGAESLRLYRRNTESSDKTMYWKSKAAEYRQLARFYKRRAFAYADPDNDEEGIFSSDSDIAEEPEDHPPYKHGMGPPDQDSDGGAGGASEMLC